MRRTRSADRDAVIAAAIEARKIPVANADQYRRRWDANPQAIRSLHSQLSPGFPGSSSNPTTGLDM